MKADPADQRRLLDLQDLDARAHRLSHQLATLPELEELKALHAQRTDLDGLVVDAQMRVDDLSVEQKRIDRDVESVKARRERDRARMESGQIPAKDLSAMAHEMESLERRIASLEDDEIEIMQQLEDAQRELDEHRKHLDETMARGRATVAARDEKAAALRSELEQVGAERSPIAGGISQELLGLYDKVRASKDGVGAAELRARRCGGCQLTLDAAELNRIKTRAEDDVVRCEECQRILVRTPQSGL